jgi:hypothetical protein
MAGKNTIKVVEKAPGKPHIDYALSGGKKITFGNDELTINLAARERDEKVTLDICIDTEDGLVIGVGGNARKYVANVEIPARRYDIIEDGVDDEGNPREVPVPVDFDMSLCTLTLWEV